MHQRPRRPQKAVKLWAILFEHLRLDTGEVLLTRDEMAEAISEAPTNVSRIMGELEAVGVITRRREAVLGMRGPGRVRFFMNPNVGTHLAGAARDQAQAAAPALRLVGQD